VLITANQPFGPWSKVFPDVHHATILEMNVESYRRRAALDRNHLCADPSDNQSTTRIASPKNVPQKSTVASLKMFPLPHAAPEHQLISPFFCSTRAASILSSRPA
jgi:hypothetical protein